jgi:hypothetical protein
MRRRDLLAGLSLVPLAAPAVAQCVLPGFPRSNRPGRCEVSGVGYPALDLSFMSPGSLDPRITFTRASTGTYFNGAGVMQTAAINVPRWDYDPVTLQLRGLLIEEQRTNGLLNSATLSTQSVAVTAIAYTLSFYGTGTITKSGTATGALVGTGATQRVSQTFTPTAGSLTLTVTGSVTNAQLEAGVPATSYIPTTSVGVTRQNDSCQIPPANMGWFTSPGGSWFAEFINYASVAGYPRGVLIPPAPGAKAVVMFDPSGHGIQFDGSVVAATVNSATLGAVTRMASTWAASVGRVCMNGGAVASAALTTGYATAATNGIAFLVGDPFSTENMIGHMRGFKYWPRVLTDAELQQITS